MNALWLSLAITAGVAVYWNRRAAHFRSELAITQTLLDRAVVAETMPFGGAAARANGFTPFEGTINGHPIAVLIPARGVREAEAGPVLHGSAEFLRTIARALDEACPSCSHRPAETTKVMN